MISRTGGTSRCRRPKSGAMSQKAGFELLPVGAVVDPFARGGDPLTGGNGCGMADHGHDLTMPARLDAQDAEAVLLVVVGDALDETGEHLLIGSNRLCRRDPCGHGPVL